MEYSIEQMQKPKNERRGGKTTSVIADAIGKLMVTENAVVVIYVSYMNRMDNITKTFISLCKNHFKETPVIKNNSLFIDGYSSRIIIDRIENSKYHSSDIVPCFDLD